MSFRPKWILLCAAVLAAGCAGLPQAPGGNSAQASPAGENPWARYSRLTLDLGGDLQYVYEQGRGEFTASVVERTSGEVKLRALSIPRAGVFYSPAEAAPCEAAPIQRLGLYSELVLYYLARAFPGGPDSVGNASDAAVDGAIPELHFMEGSLKSRGDIHAMVRALRSAGGPVDYVVSSDKDKFQGKWEAGKDAQVIPDGTLLDGWNACWYGVKTMAGGQPVFLPDIPATQALKSFGEVRRAAGNLAPAPAAAPAR